MMDPRQTGAAVRVLREARAWSIEDHCEQVPGCTVAALRALDAGEANMSTSALERVVEPLGVQLDWRYVSRYERVAFI